MRFLISAGEASGEAYGAQLVRTLRARVPGAEFFGLGGEALRAAGCDTVVDTRDIAVVGLAEVVTHLPNIYANFRKLLRAIDKDGRRPDAAILIDSPDFNFRLARELNRRGVPVFYYVSPQLWAWRAGRIKLVRQYVRKMLVIFPFEERWYRERRVDVVYVGHPLADLAPPRVSRDDFAREYGLDAAKRWMALLPGSRRKEVRMNLPRLLEVASRMGRQYQFVLPVASTLDAEWMRRRLRHRDLSVVLTRDARATLLHAHVAVVASGTATLEAALLGTPSVMVYRVSWLTWLLGRWLVNVPAFCIVNLIAGSEVVPEFVQRGFRPGFVTGALKVLADGPSRDAQLKMFAQVRDRLRSPASAAKRAAEVILEALTAGEKQSKARS